MIKCQFADGNTGNLRHVTVGGVIVRDNKILLVKRSEKLSEPGKYCLPGGFLSLNEQIVDGAVREVQEETGYQVVGAQLFYFTDDPKRLNELNQNVCFYFIIKVGEKTSEPDWEVTEIKWFDLTALPPAEQLAFDHYKVIQIFLQKGNKKEVSFDHGSTIDLFTNSSKT